MPSNSKETRSLYNDNDNCVKSEDTEIDSDAQSCGDNVKVKPKFAQLSNTASDSESNGMNQEDQAASKVQLSTTDDSNSGIASNITKGEASSCVGDSDSDSNSKWWRQEN